MHCLRICAYILRNALPGSTHVSRSKFALVISSHWSHIYVGGVANVADRTQLIKTAFETFSSIATSFDAGMQEEVRTVAVSLYGGK